tara:strand:- start:1094 stop:1288 length:195 start_codon:yes stop_codon:yes gene_type:complete
MINIYYNELTGDIISTGTTNVGISTAADAPYITHATSIRICDYTVDLTTKELLYDPTPKIKPRP